jgi:hypothetical protein
VGYVNRDRRIVHVSRKEKRHVNRLRRRAEQRALKGQHLRTAIRATKRGWWYA